MKKETNNEYFQSIISGFYADDKITKNSFSSGWLTYVIGFLSAVLIAGILLYLSGDFGADEEKFSNEEMVILYHKNIGVEELTIPALVREIKQSGVMFPEIVLAQAVKESAHFSSPIFIEGNNMFGMKLATRRPTTRCGEVRGYSAYSSWKESVRDYALYQAAYLKDILKKDAYLAYLGKRYASDKNYVKSIIQISKKYEKFFL